MVILIALAGRQTRTSDTINDVGICARELVSNLVIRLGAGNVGSGVDANKGYQRERPHMNVPAGPVEGLFREPCISEP